MSEQAVRHFHPHRLNALADGVFAIAMTLLALEIRVPAAMPDRQAFQHELPSLLGDFGVFALAFSTIGQYWLGHHRVMAVVHTVDPRAVGRALVSLIGVAAIPAGMRLIFEDGQFPEAVTVVALLMAVTSLLTDRFYRAVLTPQLSDVDPLLRLRYLLAPLYNTAVYLFTIPLAFAIAAAGAAAAWAALAWMLLAGTAPVSAALARRIATRPKAIRPGADVDVPAGT
jgi:uncharacterized membrane protein